MKLPQPSPEALAQSGHLVDHLRSLIDSQGGWISFATYMAEALYTPGLGYYSGGAHKFGPGGDFITAPVYRGSKKIVLAAPSATMPTHR